MSVRSALKDNVAIRADKEQKNRPAVCAVIVTYHPSHSMVQHFQEVSAQVDKLVIVDNASNADELQLLRGTSERQHCRLLENTENLGIAEALNQGIRIAREYGFQWVLLLDQDSHLTERFVDGMFETWAAHPQRDGLAAIHPRYVDPKTGSQSPVRRAGDGGPVSSMTSGALMPTWIFDEIGWFASDYFIDCVDTEYSFRIRAAGYAIADSTRAELSHATGDAQICKILGFSFHPTHHSLARRYYMSRNRVVLFRQYLSIFPGWTLASMYDGMRDTLKCLIGEPNRATKLRYILLGTWDGLTGRLGRRENF